MRKARNNSEPKGRKLHYHDTGLDRVLYVSAIDELPFENSHAESYSKFYVVKDFNNTIFMYLAKGHEEGPREVVVFYRNNKFHMSYRNNFKEAVVMGFNDAIHYM